LPRRYRPPTRRRKQKKQSPFGEIEAPSYEGAVAPASPARPAAVDVPVRDQREQQPTHIARDHSYVLADLRRVALIVGFILAGLIITAILR
jgi:hypothetical protein